MKKVSTLFLVGSAGAAGYMLLAGLLTAASLSPWKASLLSYATMVPIVYLAQRRFTFRAATDHVRSFPKYLATQVVGVAISTVLPYGFGPQEGLAQTLVFGLVVVVVFAVNFLLLNFWVFASGSRVPSRQYNLAAPGSITDRISTWVRRRMFHRFLAELAPDRCDLVLDIGVTSDRAYASSNYFEQLYPHKDRITAAGIDDASFLETLYPGVRFCVADALDLPFADASFDIVHSSAVLEHVGSAANQEKMIRECLRVARKGIFLTTPNRWFPVEFHTQIPLLHWLPKPVFRKILIMVGQANLAEEANLNLMTESELRAMAAVEGWNITHGSARLLGWKSNLILVAKRTDATSRRTPAETALG